VHQILNDINRIFFRGRATPGAAKIVPLVLCLLFIGSGDAQEASREGTINGKVVDQANGVLQDAAVILLNGAASVRLQQTKTGQDGAFTFENVPPGDYTVEVQRTGFTQAEKRVSLTAAQGSAPLLIQMVVAGPGQQVNVTAEVDSFQTDESSTATKMNIPLNEIPQGVGVANQALIQSQQDVYFADAANNISGVNRDVLLAGDIGNALTIRGLPLGIFSNYYRDGFAFDGMVPSDSTDVDRVEILKGPASVLYGRATSSGIVNLITKEPQPATHFTFTLQTDRFGAVRPTFDLTGPVGSSDKLFYRLNAELADTSSFRNYFHDRRYSLAPALTWRPQKTTAIRFLIEYLHGSTSTDYGIPALGDRPAPVSINSYYGEPWQHSHLQNELGSVDVSHNLSSRWIVRSRFRATLTDWNYLDTSLGYLLPDNQTFTRYDEDTAYPLRLYDWQTDITGIFKTGRIEHNFLVGFEYGFESVVQRGVFSDAPPINLFNPVYFSQTMPSAAALAANFFNPNDPDYFPISGTTRLMTHGGYIQDQISLLPKLKVLAGVRFEGFTQKYDELDYDTHNRQSNVSALPRIGITYQVLPALSLYASWSRSFSPTLAAQFGPNGLPFVPEKGTQYEAGARTSELHGRLTSSVALYRIRSSNLLITNPGNPLASIQLGDVESRGIEVDTSGRILPGWNVTFAYAYNEATAISDPVYPVGNTLQNAPRHSGSIWTVYEIQRGALRGLSFGGGVQARSYRYVDPADDVILPGYARLDGTVSYVFGPSRNEEKRYRVAVNFQNLTNRLYYISGNTPNSIFPGSPINAMMAFQVRY
jgi:iron complex outermembrane recepter protein